MFLSWCDAISSSFSELFIRKGPYVHFFTLYGTNQTSAWGNVSSPNNLETRETQVIVGDQDDPLSQAQTPDENLLCLLAATWPTCWEPALPACWDLMGYSRGPWEQLSCLPTLACLCMAHIFLSSFRYLRTSPCLACAFLSIWGWCHSGHVLAKDPLKITGANNDGSAS